MPTASYGVIALFVAISVQLQNGKFPSGYCWSGPQPFADDLVALITGKISGNFSGVIVSATPPSVSDQDKAWLKTDNNGKPIGLFLFQGLWIWPHPILPNASQIMIWDDTEANLWAYERPGESPIVDPSSVAPTATTGSFWQKAANFNDRVPAGANSAITQGASAGSLAAPALLQSDLPNVKIALESDSGSGNWVDSANHGTGGVDATTTSCIDNNPLSNKKIVQTKSINGAVAQTQIVLPYPPYRGVIFAKRTARIYFTAT